MVKIIFWLSVFLILYAYLGYPLVLYLLALLRPKQVKKGDILPTVTLIIPAYNEEKIIREKLDNSLALDYPKEKIQIIVGSDGSNDRTNEVVEEYAVRGVTLVASQLRKGKRATLFKCVQQAKGKILVFSDADAILRKDTLKKLIRNFNDKTIGCVDCIRIDANPQGVVAESIYWKYETYLKKLESRNHSLLGATGALFALRKELYSPVDEKHGDDFELAIRVAQKGFGVVCEPEAVVFHRWLNDEEEFSRIVRIVSWYFPITAKLSKESLKPFRGLLFFQLMSHKILRRLVPFFMIAILISNFFVISQPFYRTFFWCQIIFYTLAGCAFLLEKNKIKITSFLKIPYFFCLINLASLVGIFKAIIKRPVELWEKAMR